MGSRCGEFEELIDREAHGWSEAERLRVEDHLHGCDGCQSMLSLARVVRDAIDSAAQASNDISVDRALARAFAASKNEPGKIYASNARKVGIASSVLALAAAAVLLIWSARQAQRSPAAPIVAQAPSAPQVAPPKTAEPAVTPPQVAWIETSDAEVRTFAHASVRLSAHARVRFDDARSELMLERGSVEVSVDPVAHRAFRVATQHFRVEVLGTKFVVDDTSVSVIEGRVRVVDHQGQTLSQELGAGGRFTYEGAASTASEPKSTSSPSPAPSADAWLTRARAALARGEKAEARTLIARADASSPRRNDKAEALTLRAELALVEREPALAIRFYERVAKQYGDLTAGENGAFAAAQLAARSEPKRARALFTQYLSRYPHGRFSEEAKKRLSSLTAE
jgi:ferric-dicitrate binding protein FerR (iron transport regulator)